jgi:hypothetical protein
MAQKLGSELDRATRELTDLVKYADVAIFLNGVQINKDPKTLKWDLETEDAYYDFKASGEFKLYNMGFYVRDYPATTYGSAIVVTKTHVKLNMARNQVLENECPLWKRITAVLKTNMTKGPKRGKMDDTMRGFLSRAVRFGEQTKQDIQDLKIITLVTGANVAFDTIFRSNYNLPIASAPKGHTLGQRVHNANLAYVLADDTLSRFGATSITEFKEVISSILHRDCPVYEARSWDNRSTTTIESVGAAFLTSLTIADSAKLTPTEKAALKVINDFNFYIAHRTEQGTGTGRKISLRKIMAGESDTALAWTDGHSYIAVSRQLLNTARHGLCAWIQILHTIVHEYVHDEFDGESTYVHSSEFYETLDRTLTHQALFPKGSVYSVAQEMAVAFLKEMMKKNVKSKALKKQEAIEAIYESLEDAE